MQRCIMTKISTRSYSKSHIALKGLTVKGDHKYYRLSILDGRPYKTRPKVTLIHDLGSDKVTVKIGEYGKKHTLISVIYYREDFENDELVYLQQQFEEDVLPALRAFVKRHLK